MTDCPHANLNADCHVNSVMLPSGQLAVRMVTAKVTCKDCGLPFWFPGQLTGTTVAGSATDTSGRALTFPVVPVGERYVPDPSIPSVVIRNGDTMKGHP
jgi:hypothetical protein